MKTVVLAETAEVAPLTRMSVECKTTIAALMVKAMSYGCQQILINPDKDLKALLECVCTEANNLINCGIYYSRQYYFKTGKFPSIADLHKQIGTIQKNRHYQALLPY